MLCRVEGCTNKARYKKDPLCQTHYHRKWRNGDLDVHRKKAVERYERNKGYQYIYMPSHPLTAKGQLYVPEHRVVLYSVIGDKKMNCAICGCDLNWNSCHVDHIDENPRNNSAENLRPTCLRCNVWRSMPPAHVRMKSAHAVTFDGETKTPSEWARDPRVSVSGSTIIRRICSGMSDEDALFGKKATHNGNKIKPSRRKTAFAHERKNSISLTIDGVTLTAAEWSRDPKCSVTDGAIRLRVASGWNDRDAVFKPGRLAKK